MKTIALLLLAGLGSTNAAAQQGTPPQVVIEAVTPDANSGTLTITGANFGPRPFVTLNLIPLNVQLGLDPRIVAAVPLDMIPPGKYLLTVSRGPAPSDTAASYEVQIGPEPSPSAAVASGSLSPPAATDAILLPAPTDPAAKVGDHVITLADVDREWQRMDPSAYLAASRLLYDGRSRVATEMVNNELLAREAADRGVTVDALLKEEVPKRTVPMPDSAVTGLYQSLGDRARGASLDQMRPAIRAWLARNVEPDLAKMTYVEELMKVSTRADVFLTAPRVNIEHHADDPVLGPATAPVELVAFGDFESPAYARFALALGRVRDTFGNRVRIVFKHLPVSGPASISAAEAAACANAQGKFWPYHDKVLSEAGALDAARFRTVARDVGLDGPAFDTCFEQDQFRAEVRRALDEAQRYDIPGSPSFLINGQLAPDPPSFLPPFEFFKRIIEQELEREAKDAAARR
jgi:protein-disulfide isomerase